MFQRSFLYCVLTGVTILLGPCGAIAPNTAHAQDALPSFRPTFGDLMNTLVQPRHAKLGLAAGQQNWPLAGYAIHELKDALTNIARWRPQFRKMSVAEMMASTTGEPIKAVEVAIEARDVQKLTDGYARLTEGCNSCHAALNHAFVVIQVPDQSSFANQNFKATK